MKFIDKNDSPEEFEAWKQQENPKNWNDLPSSKIREDRKEEGINYYSKEELRTSLINEQGFICGYCQDSVLNDHTSKIEHIKARGVDAYKKFTFDYNNLIICCKGEKLNPPPKELHCDTFRDNKDILVTPLMTDCDKHFRYSDDGHIHSESDDASITISRLNLDTPKLVNRRKEIIEGWLPEDLEITEEDMQAIKQLMNKRDADNSFEPFCQVIENILIV